MTTADERAEAARSWLSEAEEERGSDYGTRCAFIAIGYVTASYPRRPGNTRLRPVGSKTRSGVMSATVEQLASQIQVLLDDAYRRGVQQGLRAAAEAVQQLIPDPPATDGEIPPDDAMTTDDHAAGGGGVMRPGPCYIRGGWLKVGGGPSSALRLDESGGRADLWTRAATARRKASDDSLHQEYLVASIRDWAVGPSGWLIADATSAEQRDLSRLDRLDGLGRGDAPVRLSWMRWSGRPWMRSMRTAGGHGCSMTVWMRTLRPSWSSGRGGATDHGHELSDRAATATHDGTPTKCCAYRVECIVTSMTVWVRSLRLSSTSGRGGATHELHRP